MFLMKKSVSFFSVLFVTILSILCLSFGLGFSSQNATAETLTNSSSTIDTITNGKFSVTAEASGRRNVTIFNEKVAVTTKSSEEIEYYCYKWRDISYLTFNFSANLSQEIDSYTHYRFVVSHIQTEDLETSTGLMTTQTELLGGGIISNSVSIPKYYYYIDSNVQYNEQSGNRSRGKDFGLYRFQFLYTITQESNIGDPPIDCEIELGSIFIAVLPDDIETISLQNLTIKYSVSSSNKLMNVYNLYLSAEDEFKYVNPNFIEWSVIGRDRASVDYVLSLKMKNSKIAYANYRVVWDSQLDPVGPTFTFDSNNIEGTWTAYCTIYNRDGSERATLLSAELSTLKTPVRNVIWIVLGVALTLIVAGSLVGLVIYRVKKRKSM